MKVFCVPVGPFEMNSYIVQAEDSSSCILIDPGDDLQKIEKVMEQSGLVPKAIFNTHNHIDHARRVSLLQKKFKLPFYISQEDLPLLESLKDQALLFGLDTSPIPDVTRFLKDGDTFKLGEEEYRILLTPGHSPGSICILFKGHVFVGDVLFKDSIGRTDLYGGNYKQLMQSIDEKLMTLPEETIVYPGHGPTTTIGREKQHNPFLNAKNII